MVRGFRTAPRATSIMTMALRFQTLQAGPAMQIPVFLILFMKWGMSR